MASVNSWRSAPDVIRLQPHEYIHITDNNTCEVLTLVGPLSFTLNSNFELIHKGPQPCVVVPPNHYVIVHNPVRRSGGEAPGDRPCPFTLVSSDPDALKRPAVAKCLMGQREYRMPQSPFPLFPGERAEAAKRMWLLSPLEALLLEATHDFNAVDDAGRTVARAAREKYLFKGPGYYRPRVEESVKRLVRATVVKGTQALRLVAHVALQDAAGVSRAAGEEWVECVVGLYFPPPGVAVLRVMELIPLSADKALHVRATTAFVDRGAKTQRVIGDEYLVTHNERDAFIPDNGEQLVREVPLITVGPRQYCIVRHPYRDGNTHWGELEIRVGITSFFTHPGETIVGGAVQDAFVLTPSESLLVEARESFTDDDGIKHKIASRWLIDGPRSYVPALQVRVVERRRVLALNQAEGVYVRNVCTNNIRSVHGGPLRLGADEELWEKPVSPYIRLLMRSPRLSLRGAIDPELLDRLADPGTSSSAQHDASRRLCGDPELQREISAFCRALADERRAVEADAEAAQRSSGIHVQPEDTHRYSVVSVNVEQNTLVRLYDVSDGRSRVEAGPAAIVLGPQEEFTPLCLSGGRPKAPAQIHTLALYLGPDYMADIIEVETLDHARLRLHLAYNWEFDTSDMERTKRNAFTIPDFIGEACKTLASRVRAVLAGVSFEDFHRHSTSIIKQAIFSSAADGSTEVREETLHFLVNGLVVTNVDVQSVEPVDLNTRVALTKAVQLAVEIITKAQENEATHQAALLEQEAKGALELQTIRDSSDAESDRVRWLQRIVTNAAIEQGGASTAQALAEGAAREVEAQSDLEATPLRCAAHEIGVEAELHILHQRMEADLAHRKAMNDVAVEKARSLADIEATKYEKIMAALGKETLIALARAGPEMQSKLLGSLGLQGFLVTDGSVPINLMNVAERLTEKPQKS